MKTKLTITVRHGIGTVIKTYADQTEYLIQWKSWVVQRFSKPKITYNFFTGPTPEEAPKPRLKSMVEISSDYDPNGEQRKLRKQLVVGRKECYTVTSAYSGMQAC